MQSLNSLKSNVFHVNELNFQKYALELFIFQFNNNKIYQYYVQNLGIDPKGVTSIDKIPFLPIQFFKQHKITTGSFSPEQIFVSSGTTGNSSRHYMEDLKYYNKISAHIFCSYFGKLDQSVIIGLLPSYVERGNSSLVYMVNHFIEESKNENSGFYLDNYDSLAKKLEKLIKGNVAVFLFGVTFALLEFAKHVQFEKNKMVIIETGGMKGRGREIIREELHGKLSGAFNTGRIYSEYGMTELLSQAYLQQDGFFHSPPWMRTFIREIHDPFNYVENGQTGVINVIDLANVHSCAFIETEDLGVQYENGFKVMGRMDNTDLRGCNLLFS